jgi:hypothetical protein
MIEHVVTDYPTAAPSMCGRVRIGPRPNDMLVTKPVKDLVGLGPRFTSSIAGYTA